MTIIAAIASDGAIGRNGDLLWHISKDLKHFKSLTLGKTVIMGRNTWESLPKRPLPGRRNIVVTRNEAYRADGAEIFSNLEQALAASENDAFIIGGGQLYAAALPMANAMELTEIYADAEDADTYFPEINHEEWRLCSSEKHKSNGLEYSFNRYERINESNNSK